MRRWIRKMLATMLGWRIKARDIADPHAVACPFCYRGLPIQLPGVESGTTGIYCPDCEVDLY